MRIIRDDEGITISSNVICPNDNGVNIHLKPSFEFMGDRKYKCGNCGAVLIIHEPTLINDQVGMMKISTRIEVEKND